MTGPALLRTAQGREAFLAENNPKWGVEAARLGWRAEKVRRGVILAVILDGLALLIPSSAWVYLLVAGTVMATAVIAAFGWTTARMFKVASRQLGVPVGWRSAPPRQPHDYEEWCARVGVVPYAAMEPSEGGCHQSTTGD